MSDSPRLDLIEKQIEQAEEDNNHKVLQRLYLARERAQKRQFEASLKRRAKGKP